MVLSCYHEQISKDLLLRLWRFCNPKFEKWKTRKSGLVPVSRQKNLRIYFWYSLPDLKHDQKHFIRIYSFIKRSRNEVLRHFLVNFIKPLPWKRCTEEKFHFSFGCVFASSITVQKFITLKWQDKKLSMIKIFKFFVSDHLKITSF